MSLVGKKLLVSISTLEKLKMFTFHKEIISRKTQIISCKLKVLKVHTDICKNKIKIKKL